MIAAQAIVTILGRGPMDYREILHAVCRLEGGRAFRSEEVVQGLLRLAEEGIIERVPVVSSSPTTGGFIYRLVEI
jgi:hypothetical protein